MTKRQQTRTVRVTSAIFAAALAAVGVPAATPAQAAVPAVANTYAALMQRSLTVTATGVLLRQTLVSQKAGVTSRTATVAEITTAAGTAGKQVVTATAVARGASSRLSAAKTVLATAQKNLAAVKPADKTGRTRAQTAVTNAEKVVALRTTQARTAARSLSTAKNFQAAAEASLAAAKADLKVWTDGVALTQQRIAALPTPAALAAQAAALDDNVVTAVRPAFSTADTTSVYGTTVHRSIAFSYQRMVDDAKKAGVQISGGGFRTKARQIELRKINGCPDVYTAPASSCRVPTAVPGRSLHELGLAVDVTSGGRTINSASPAFKWLKLHGGEYGFKNLPSEAWHWSISGS